MVGFCLYLVIAPAVIRLVVENPRRADVDLCENRTALGRILRRSPARDQAARGDIGGGQVSGVGKALLGADHIVRIDGQLDFEQLAFGVRPAERNGCGRRQLGGARRPDGLVGRQFRAGARPAKAREIGVLRPRWREQTNGRAVLGQLLTVREHHQIVDPRAFQIDRAFKLGRFDGHTRIGR